MDFLTTLGDPSIWIALLTLTVLEIVLGIDNIIFISILSNKLPTPSQQALARNLGLAVALVTRILLLLSLSWLIGLTKPLVTLPVPDPAYIEFSSAEHGSSHAVGHESASETPHDTPEEEKAPVPRLGISGRDLILLVGGLFLLAKATFEIHEKLEGEEGHAVKQANVSLVAVIIQIGLLDIVFSLDSVITAVGMVDTLWVMIAAVIIAVGVMLLAAKSISDFVEKHPTVKMLALSFLLLIGTSLVAESLHFHIPKGYIYFAMGFSVLVEMLNLRMRTANKNRNPVELRNRYIEKETH